jgi:DNA polymerase III sliding clamp (beta) subunit (PCNA family)
LCLVLPLVFLPRIGGQIALCNLVIGIVNLVPFPSSDGLRILRMLRPQHTRLVSTDGNRFSLVELPGASAESLAILIPRTAIEPLMALTGAGGANEIAVAVDDTRICLSGGARQLSARRVTGNPQITRLSCRQGRELTVDRQPLLHAIEHIVQFNYSR